MKLHELLSFNDIVIQCHDNPDADALASGYALYTYLKKNGKDPRFIYRGRWKIGKFCLMLMMEALEIPISYEPDFDEVPELLVLTDCQYGQKNVTTTEAKTIAVIDHHQISGELPPLSEVRSRLGSCSTLMWDMLREEGISLDDNVKLSTALYYGLYTDTNKLSEVSHPLDRDMIDSLIINKSLVKEMSNSNITLGELKITGKAILGSEYSKEHRYLIIQAEPCDPVILGVMSDFSMETENVDICVAYYDSPTEVKFSVRSCVKEVHADEVADYIADGFGGGGGHIYKAGGILWPDKLALAGVGVNGATANDFIRQRLDDYYAEYEILYARTAELDRSDMKLYEKRPQLLGTVKMTDLFPAGTPVEIRTLEGDVTVRIDNETFLMIGVEGEVYPIKEEKLRRSYTFSDEAYTRSFEYDPSIKDMLTGERKNVLEHVRSVIAKGGARVYAKPLTTHVKLFTAWDEEKYYSGVPGDFIASREDDPHDIYVIRRRLMDQLYKEVSVI
ncbi:MAG: DHH family phosphoesterase [Eubacterium sp.]|nr:DHH family phosphoesterase [Eubacterium sp.]